MAKEDFAWVIPRFYGLRLDQSSRTIDAGAMIKAIDIDMPQLDVLKGRRGKVATWPNLGAIRGMVCWHGSVYATTATDLYKDGVLFKASWGGWFDWCIINQWLYMVNGVSFIRTDGTSVYTVGITAPAVGSFAAAGTGAGSFTVGDWDYVVTFVDGDGFESNACTAVTATNQGDSQEKCALTGIPTGDSTNENVTKRKIYRTEDGGDIYYLLTTINDNTTTTYDDTTADADLGTTTVPTTHNIPAVDYKYIASNGERWFATKDNDRRVYYSLPFPNERAVPSTYYLDAPDYIKGICPLAHSILIMCEHAPFVIRGLSVPETFYIRFPRGPKFYVKSDYVTREFKSGAISQGAEGIYFVDEIETTLISTHVRDGLGALSASAFGCTTPEVFYIVLAGGYFETELGEIVYLTHDDDVSTFEIAPEGGGTDADYGVVVDIENDDDYVFTSEVGTVIGIGTEFVSQVIVVDTRPTRSPLQPEFYFFADMDVSAFAYDDYTGRIYLGDRSGVHSMEGDPVEFKVQFGHTHCGHPTRYKWLRKIRIDYLKGTVITNLYIDGSDESSHSNENTIYVTNTSIYVTSTVYAVNGQLYYDGPVEIQLPNDMLGVTFSLHMQVTGELHAPIVYQGILGGFV